MISKWLFSGAVLFEVSSFAAFLDKLSIVEATLLYISAHGAASALLSAGVWLLLPTRYKFPLPWSPLVLFSLSFFMPILGTLGVVLAVFPALYLPRRQKESVWRSMGVPDLPFRAQEASGELMFNDGGLQDVLRHAPNPERRTMALMATRRMNGKDSIPILKLALRDPSDDVRLLAYSMLDQQESQINQRIEKTLAQLQAAPEQQRGPLHSTLARWYWELAYMGLAQGSVLEHVLSQAREHVELALAQGVGDDAHLLAARIAMEQGFLDEAVSHLLTAKAAGLAQEKIAPFKAEIAFQQGRYTDIPMYLSQLSAETLKRPPFAELARYWL
ncbi:MULTISPECIES: HEAT repeat domain-containing protein [Pseudomonas]|uniref:HEAT repeat domain-containing protein n=1 Tax=Pseudomonas TaxID=286 RepID=UPI000C0EECE0|nr:transporter [Pseudomonadaceae bacterium]HCP54119.1 transporter [Pseudomonas sp.]|tara:strand:+ start:414 stop:1403 length:990 start_codon:yes stop_codon:yes gene_type:complete